MTHLAVLVIGDKNIEKALLPYHEFETTALDNEYVKEIDITTDIKAEYAKYKDEGESLIEYIEQNYRCADGTYMYYTLNKDGTVKNVIRRTNPDARWDWYEIGGRFEGKLITNDNVKTNQARVKDINLKASYQAGLEVYLKKYEQLHAHPSAMKDFKTFKEILAKSTDEETAKKLFWAQEAQRIYNHPLEGLPEYYKLEKPQFETYIREHYVFCWNYVLKGKWHAGAEFGWFGLNNVTSEKSREWNLHLNELFNNLNPETWLTIVDVHK